MFEREKKTPEQHRKPLAPLSKVISHLLRNLLIGLLFILMALFIGMVGYHGFEHMSWIDAFVNAAMILSGMGPLTPLATFSGKLFAGIYALFSGLYFIAIMVIMFSPIIRRFFREVHLDLD